MTNCKGMDDHLTCFQLDLLARTSKVIGSLAINLERRKGRRDLLDRASEAGHDRFNIGEARPNIAGGDDLALQVQRVGLLAEADGEVVGFGRVEHSAGELGRFAQRDRQHARRQRIERPAMADLGLGLAGVAQGALDRADRLGRAESDRLVEDDPAAERHGGRDREAHGLWP
jgi:hypothetical protein